MLQNPDPHPSWPWTPKVVWIDPLDKHERLARAPFYHQKKRKHLTKLNQLSCDYDLVNEIGLSAETECIWWPAAVIPRSDIKGDFSITPHRKPKSNELYVRYFEDNTFSIVMEADVMLFTGSDPLFHWFKNRNPNEIESNNGVRRALRFVNQGLVSPGFVWAKWHARCMLLSDAQFHIPEYLASPKPNHPRSSVEVTTQSSDLDDLVLSSSSPPPPPPHFKSDNGQQSDRRVGERSRSLGSLPPLPQDTQLCCVSDIVGSVADLPALVALPCTSRLVSSAGTTGSALSTVPNSPAVTSPTFGIFLHHQPSTASILSTTNTNHIPFVPKPDHTPHTSIQLPPLPIMPAISPAPNHQHQNITESSDNRLVSSPNKDDGKNIQNDARPDFNLEEPSTRPLIPTRHISARELDQLGKFFYVADSINLPPTRKRRLLQQKTLSPVSPIRSSFVASSNLHSSKRARSSSTLPPQTTAASSTEDDDDVLSSVPVSPDMHCKRIRHLSLPSALHPHPSQLKQRRQVHKSTTGLVALPKLLPLKLIPSMLNKPYLPTPCDSGKEFTRPGPHACAQVGEDPTSNSSSVVHLPLYKPVFRPMQRTSQPTRLNKSLAQEPVICLDLAKTCRNKRDYTPKPTRSPSEHSPVRKCRPDPKRLAYMNRIRRRINATPKPVLNEYIDQHQLLSVIVGDITKQHMHVSNEPCRLRTLAQRTSAVTACMSIHDDIAFDKMAMLELQYLQAEALAVQEIVLALNENGHTHSVFDAAPISLSNGQYTYTEQRPLRALSMPSLGMDPSTVTGPPAINGVTSCTGNVSRPPIMTVHTNKSVYLPVDEVSPNLAPPPIQTKTAPAHAMTNARTHRPLITPMSIFPRLHLPSTQIQPHRHMSPILYDPSRPVLFPIPFPSSQNATSSAHHKYIPTQTPVGRGGGSDHLPSSLAATAPKPVSTTCAGSE